MRELYLYPGARDSAHFTTLLEKQHSLFGLKLRPAARRALVRFTQNFYRRVYPPDGADADAPFDFGNAAIVQEYMNEARNLVRSKVVMPEYTLLARSEMGLYHILHRLKARVHTSRIVPEYLQLPPPAPHGK